MPVSCRWHSRISSSGPGPPTVTGIISAAPGPRAAVQLEVHDSSSPAAPGPGPELRPNELGFEPDGPSPAEDCSGPILSRVGRFRPGPTREPGGRALGGPGPALRRRRRQPDWPGGPGQPPAASARPVRMRPGPGPGFSHGARSASDSEQTVNYIEQLMLRSLASKLKC
jgi:hypothetical protein